MQWHTGIFMYMLCSLGRRSRYIPLCCSAKSGKHDIVSYLLSIREVTPEGVGKEQVYSYSI